MTINDVRPAVQWFAMQMEETLRKHDEAKDGWDECDGDWLYERLLTEAQELENELHPLGDTPVVCDRVIAEAVDVANYAFFIADNHRDQDGRGSRGR